MTVQIKRLVAIVPAAGKGRRMQADIPKQYLMINRQAVIAHTLNVLLEHPRIDQVVVAVSSDDEHFDTLEQARHPKLQRVIGGQERADSVLAGLRSLDDRAWALVHDAARPCLMAEDIDKLIAGAQQSAHGAILAVPVRDTIKRGDSQRNIVQTVCRDDLWRALTPQLFPVGPLRTNLMAALAAGESVTDEASAMEWAGLSPKLIFGRTDNIKITHPDDLRLAALSLTHRE